MIMSVHVRHEKFECQMMTESIGNSKRYYLGNYSKMLYFHRIRIITNKICHCLKYKQLPLKVHLYDKVLPWYNETHFLIKYGRSFCYFSLYHYIQCEN